MKRDEVSVDFALQGGGSHGAFTWGALDRLLEEPWLRIDAISGTSAGAMNAAVLAHGYAQDGAAGARQALEAFWRKVSRAARWSPLRRSPVDVMLGRWTLDQSLSYLWMDMAARVFSPYDLNPRRFNPLRDILTECISFERLQQGPIRLFVTATNVRTGQGRIFRRHELSPEALLASACLPTLFHAVEIDGEAYWDGGYSGNPTITPLVRESDAQDTILVQVNPVIRNQLPRSARDILSRLNEVSFNATLLKELRMISLLGQVATSAGGEAEHWAHMRMHRLTSDVMLDLGHSSKLNAEWPFLLKLRDAGREAAAHFIEAHGAALGHHATLDMDAFSYDD